MPQGNNNKHRAQKIDIENRLQIIAPLYRRGWTEREITAEVRKRLDRPKYNQAHCDIQRLLKEWREERLTDTDEKITSEVARLKLVIREAWEAWEKSKADYNSKTQTQVGLPNKDPDTGLVTMDTVKAIMFDAEKRGFGEPRYLDIIIKAETQICKLLDYQGVMACFADPTIILFLGGFVLAIAATKSGLDVMMAKALIAPFGKRSENVLLGFMLITGIFSMFISNTATAAMMLTFLTPVFKSLPPSGKGRVALTMAIPIGANLGGMGTPIGTPPNAFAFKVLNDPAGLNLGLSFGDWMLIMAPMVLIMLLMAWVIIRKMFPFSAKTIELNIEGNMQHNWRTTVVAVTFLATIVLWVFGKQLGINANTVAMLPIAVFALTGVVTAKDLKEIDWAVIWMVAGGFALGLAMNGTGLAEAAVKSIPFTEFNPLVIMIVSGLVCFILSNFISNTATAALLIPILTVVCTGMGDKLNTIGGTSTILIGVAVSASCAMSLPISTPPNAIAYSTGLIQQTDMVKAGLTVGILSMIVGYAVLITFCKMGVL